MTISKDKNTVLNNKIKFPEHLRIFMVIWANDTNRLANRTDMPLSDRNKIDMGIDIIKSI